MATYSKPYDAIFKRAEDVFNAGQKQDALQLLHDLITSRRYRAWQKVHEKIKSKYIELSVDMRRGRFDKLDDLIRVLLSNEGFQNVKLVYLGGLWVMIELESLKTKKKLMQHVGVASWFNRLCNAQSD
ncbi:eukaryotic translation initiation factor 3 subunit A-like protein, partial [Tanacetum coccineum]